MSEQGEPSTAKSATAGQVVAAAVTAVAGWVSFRVGTQPWLPEAYALAAALMVGAVVGILAGLLVTNWQRRPRSSPEPEPEPVEPPEPEPSDLSGVDLVALIRALVAEQRARFDEAGTVLQTMMSGRVRVDAEPREITAELSRLLDESFEATRRLERGEVLIGVARKTAATGVVARITVTDNRVGATATLTLPLAEMAADRVVVP